jgi:hypothetical protein
MEILIILLIISLITIVYLFISNKKIKTQNENLTKIAMFNEGVVLAVLTNVSLTLKEADTISQHLNKLAEKAGVNNPFVLVKKGGEDDDILDNKRE